MGNAPGTILRFLLSLSLVAAMTPSFCTSESANVSSDAVDPTFVYHQIYANPDPSSKGEYPTIYADVGLADIVEVRIYNLTGELVDSVELKSPKIVAGRYVYDYTWRPRDMETGVYVFLVRAFKEGQSTIKQLKKISLIV